jgi:hypothetical protein
MCLQCLQPNKCLPIVLLARSPNTSTCISITHKGFHKNVGGCIIQVQHRVNCNAQMQEYAGLPLRLSRQLQLGAINEGLAFITRGVQGQLARGFPLDAAGAAQLSPTSF